MTPAAARPNPDAVLLPGFTGSTLPDWLAERLRGGLAGVCLFGGNIAAPGALRELTDAIRAANPRAIIAIDEEGGDVTRLHFAAGSPYPGNAVLGRIDDLERTERVGRMVGDELRLAGVNLDFAPDVDVNSNPDNPVIGVRSFGTDPAVVAAHGVAWMRGLQSTGVAACAKHFPGHGDTAQDSHHAVPVVDIPLERLLERELVPFAAAIAAGTRTIMSSHVLLPRLDPANPATFSRDIIEGLLRARLGFDGLVVTDALDMTGASGAIGIPEAAVRAVTAGCDLLCLGMDNTDAQLDDIGQALGAAPIGSERWAAATRRITELADFVTASPPPPWQESITPVGDTAATRAVFELRDGMAVPTDPLVLVVETASNMAVGHSPWGLSAAGFSVVTVREGDRVPDTSGRPVLVIGKANHRHAWVRELVDDLRSHHPSAVVVVDMGWPGEDRCYADIATFGGSRHVGAALAEWLRS